MGFSVVFDAAVFPKDPVQSKRGSEQRQRRSPRIRIRAYSGLFCCEMLIRKLELAAFNSIPVPAPDGFLGKARIQGLGKREC